MFTVAFLIWVIVLLLIAFVVKLLGDLIKPGIGLIGAIIVLIIGLIALLR